MHTHNPKSHPIKDEFSFANRMQCIPKSFIREILKVTAQPDVISFAGGLPNPQYFPVEALKNAAIKVLEQDGCNALQYAVSEGYKPLREYIAMRYKLTQNLDIDPDEILITNGSQQGIDLAGKVFLNPQDKVLLESPSYLGAIQAFSAYEPEFVTVDLQPDGIDTDTLRTILETQNIKLMYAIPNFQNPTGISYSIEKRMATAELLRHTNTILVEDDPYGSIEFTGQPMPSIKNFLPRQTILLGSFSKIASPGMRLGWVAADKKIIAQMIIAKQATDLHSNFLSQRIIYQFLMDNDLEAHISQIKSAYKQQRNQMLECIRNYFPSAVQYTIPEGGMFIWLTLPEGCNAFDLLHKASDQKIAFVPGGTFFLNGKGQNTMRLNYSNTETHLLEEGMNRLGKIMKEWME